MAGFTLAARFASEAIGTFCALCWANGSLAAMVLPLSKGHNMGWGWMNAAWGAGFAFAGLAFAGISAYLNPALTLAAWMLGDITVGAFFTLVAAQLIGAFLSGVALWAHHFDHFFVKAPFRRRFETEIADLVASRPNPEFTSTEKAQKDKDPERAEGLAGREAANKNGISDGNDHPGRTGDKDQAGGNIGYSEGPRIEERLENPTLTFFATCPGIKQYQWNFLSESLMTCIFVFIVRMIHYNGVLLAANPQATYTLIWMHTNILEPLAIGTLVGFNILALGGPTGGAMNPARDLGPRLAHQLLPMGTIKGKSEWNYAWVPFFGPFAGAAAGAGLFKAVSLLF